ncbi:hypothetical protein K7432_010784 [Basidiobolus ranarum]|uniref:Uncharacterized protein n=1 Tax=Basidiobolus ranarum TaxID=34480 RepID=A0ABR2VV25_9FUNG
MFAGHFALTSVLQKYYPNTSPYTLALGVGFLDVCFGAMTYLGYEGFSPNPQAGINGFDIHCNYTHSLIGSVLLSLIYGAATGSYTPGFLASFSHFIEDMMVHNQDLPLDPISKIMIGGTNMWGAFPTFAFYFELAFCLACAAFSSKDPVTLTANGLILLLHINSKSSTAQLFKEIFQLSEPLQRRYSAIIIISSFVIPGLILGFILNIRRNQIKDRKSA